MLVVHMSFKIERDKTVEKEKKDKKEKKSKKGNEETKIAFKPNLNKCCEFLHSTLKKVV
jgi:hypothetical protein